MRGSKKKQKAKVALIVALVFIPGGVLASCWLDWRAEGETGLADVPASAPIEPSVGSTASGRFN